MNQMNQTTTDGQKKMTAAEHTRITGHGTYERTTTGFICCRCGYYTGEERGNLIICWDSGNKWEIGQTVTLKKRGIRVKIIKRSKSSNCDSYSAGFGPCGPSWYYEGEEIREDGGQK